MNRLTVATVAFAAGMMTFAAYAQEAPQPPSRKPEPAQKGSMAAGPSLVDFGPEARRHTMKAGSAARAETKAEAKEDAAPEEGIDRTETSSIAPALAATAKKRARPELKTAARKKIILKGDPEVADVPAKAFKGGGSYGSIISRYAAEYGVPVSLAHAVIRVESNYRPGARGSAGEVGLMQIKPSTARGLGYSGSVKGLYNPETNIRWGMKYLGMAHKLGGGTTCGTILKYNAGHGARRMNPISAAYCAKVKRHLGGA